MDEDFPIANGEKNLDTDDIQQLVEVTETSGFNPVS